MARDISRGVDPSMQYSFVNFFLDRLDIYQVDFKEIRLMEQLRGIFEFMLKISLLGQDVNKKKQFCAECGKAMDEGYKASQDSPDAYCREDYQKLFGTTQCDVI
jgi:hypothetical protein